MDDLHCIEQSLEQLAFAEIDLVPWVYERFFVLCPQAKTLFASQEAQAVQGKMVNELIQTVMDRLEGKSYSAMMVQTMVGDHDSWGVNIAMYDAFLEAFVLAIQGALSITTDSPWLVAWRRQFSLLRADIAAHLE